MLLLLNYVHLCNQQKQMFWQMFRHMNDFLINWWTINFQLLKTNLDESLQILGYSIILRGKDMFLGTLPL